MFNTSMSSWRHRPVEKEIASRLNTKEGQFTELTCLTFQILVYYLLDHSAEVPVLFLEYREVAKKASHQWLQDHEHSLCRLQRNGVFLGVGANKFLVLSLDD